MRQHTIIGEHRIGKGFTPLELPLTARTVNPEVAGEARDIANG